MRLNAMQQKGIKAVAAQLQEFGYPDASDAYIEEAFRRWQSDEEPRDIIDRFAFRDFDNPDYRGIFGTKAAA